MSAIDAMYQKYGRVSPTQVQELHNTYLSKNPIGDKLDQMGEDFAVEVDRLLTIIDHSGQTKRAFEQILNEATKNLEKPLDQEALKKIVRELIIETTSIQRRNDDLEVQLQNARDNIETLKKHIEEIREESVMDSLTMIGNRKHFDRNLELEVAAHQESGHPMSLILCDIDHFKRFNDTWGHQAGDQVLRLVALAIKGNVKTQDIPCRYGGEEFAIILPKTNVEQATVVAERIRKTVSRRDVVKRSTGENLGRITISAGISTLHPNELGPSLIRRADLCLYAAKNSGRDRLITETNAVMRDVA
ncbi:MAG: GGDEF domain-containing protein [Pseudomonadota bacterium]